MKILIMILFTSFFTSIAIANETKKHIHEISLPIEKVFSPAGFDSNDNTQLIIQGYLPNLCYNSPRSNFKITKNTIYIDLKAYYRNSASNNCAEIAVPFIETINLGTLSPGEYIIKYNNKDNSILKIAKAASTNTDDHIYANVEYIEKTNEVEKIILKGHNPSDCIIFDHFQVIQNKNSYSILPKMKQVSNFCPKKMVPFSYELTLPNNTKDRVFLIHVRSMDGKSINTLHSFVN